MPPPGSTRENPHLALFRAMGQLMRPDPAAVIARLSAWLSDPNSPHFWVPFALSIRGFAYEIMDESDLARRDYAKGLRFYESLAHELGEDAVRRIECNASFMRVRIRSLPPPKPMSHRYTDFVIVYDRDGATF